MEHLNPNATLNGGKYRIVRFLASGGFGCTYEAVHTQLGNRVAIKEFFVKDFCNRDINTSRISVATRSKFDLVGRLRKKFIEEAQSLALMHHPGIVRVTDIFEDNGTAYYVMDFIEGRSLHQIVGEKGALSEVEAVRYISQVADALRYVHSRKRLHLDIKPGNIMVRRDGRAFLIDFGASKQYDEIGGENTSTIMGLTVGYAPMEQSGKLSQFTPATDIYSLGATFYKLVTGATPPDASQVFNQGLPPLPPTVSPHIVQAITKSMMPKVSDRFQTIDEFMWVVNSGRPANVRPGNGSGVVPPRGGVVPPISRPPVSVPPVSRPPVSGSGSVRKPFPAKPVIQHPSTPEVPWTPTGSKKKSKKWLVWLMLIILAVAGAVAVVVAINNQDTHQEHRPRPIDDPDRYSD